jgi:hypothetical protein
MMHWMKILYALFAILLVWNVSMAEGLPSGNRLILCFGSDGHIDISFTACSQGSPNIPPQKKHFSDKNKHHGDCVDFGLISGALGSGQFASLETGSPKILPKKSDALHVLDMIFTSLLPSEHRLANAISRITQVPFSAYSLISLRTIILQV